MSYSQSPYLAKQLNGPAVNIFMAGLDDSLEKANAVISYLRNLSIATAQEVELETIGELIGYPRPIVPDGFNEENLLILTTVPSVTDATNGLSEVGLEIGGVLSSLETSQNLYMSLDTYRALLPKIAYIKRYGITLHTVDQIASLFANDYSIDWTEDKDIEVTFSESLGFKNVWILTQIFYKLSTSPQVIITSEA